MKILIVDKFEEWGLERLRGLGCELRIESGLKVDAFKSALQDFGPELLIVRSTKVPAEVLAGAGRLAGIIRAGSGVDNIDVEAASKRGIQVANCPGMNGAAVAELTLGLILALDRRIPDNVGDLRRGAWKKKEYSSKALGLSGRTLGIVGAGSIGTGVARAALALDMHVLFYHLGRHRRFVDNPSCRRAELDDLLREADIVSLHLPGGPSTRNLLDERRLSLMKPTALLINTSRSGIVDEAALIRALRSGKLRGAGLDVFDNEPTADAETVATPLADVPNCYVTHHIGASTQQAQMAVAAETVRLVEQFRGTGLLPNCVNTQASPTAKYMLVVRLVNKPGGLAHVFQEISHAAINAEEMDHFIYGGGEAACAHIRVNPRPSDEVLQRIRGGATVLGVELMQVD